MYLIRSRTRHAQPHSLSYHESTFNIRPPITFVYSASTIDEFELRLKSIDTNGSSQKSRIPRNSSFAASLKARFTSSAVVSVSKSITTSTSETFGVGTRTEIPSNFPFSSGNTSATAFAAPVDVGIIDNAAARARRRSLCGRSSSCWSLVYEWIVVICAERIPNFSWTTFATGARQFVVYDAFEVTWCAAGSYFS